MSVQNLIHPVAVEIFSLDQRGGPADIAIPRAKPLALLKTGVMTPNKNKAGLLWWHSS